ncbi:MAG: YfcC family protein [Raoultibacter sp.]
MSTTEAALPRSATADPGKPKKKWKLNFPTAFTILFVITILAVAATWVVPAGSYAKLAYDPEASVLQVTSPQGEVSTLPATQEELDKIGVNIDIGQFITGALSKPISVPNTYEYLEQQPKGIQDITVSMVQGTVEAADIMVFILVLGGMIGVVNASGAFESGLLALTKKTKGREFLLVFIVSALMVLGGTTCGLEEEAVAFYPILVPIFLALGYDSIVCVGAIFLAGSMGTTFSTINPFSVVIASNAAGTTFTEGMEWRAAGCVVGAVVVIAYLYWYSRKLKADPTFSYTYEDREKFNELYAVDPDGSKLGPFTWRKKVILVLFVVAFPIMVWGVVSQHWWFPQMAASFLAIAIIIMFLSGIAEKPIVESFIAGASSLVGVSLIIGLARGINLVMEQGLISDTLLHYSSGLVAGMHGPLFIIIMMLIFFVLGFVVPSSSGLAVLSMPILAPLADTVGIPRSVVVCAYSWGQYAMLFLAPTGLVLATLTMLDMKYTHWLKFVWPMVVFVLVFGGIMLVAQVLVLS